MTPAEVAAEMRRLSVLLDEGIKALHKAATDESHAEHAYRAAKARAWVSCPPGTVPEREAAVNDQVKDERLRRDLAAAVRQSALEALRSRRVQVSALQSVLNAMRAEAEFARTGPQ